jgi:hypothetical protein
MTPAETLFITFAVTIIGSGLGTTIVGAFFKRRFDAQLETHKALLQRIGRIHGMQVDALLVIHSKLDEALFYLQRVTSKGRFRGEASDKEMLERMGRSLGAASEEFAKKRLLVSEKLGQKLDEFFKKMVFAGADINLAMDPMMTNGEPRAELWSNASETAYKEIPAILQAIRDDARAVIHG